MMAAVLCVSCCSAAEPAAIDLLWGVKIPVRDGVKLSATLFKPHKIDGPLPVIFTFTPYIGDSYEDRASYFARNGYVYALVDVRGRGNSEGTFEPFANEGRDGYDVVEWLAKQPWSNGKIAMWGGSYAGFDQWTTLKEFPPHLVTIVPAAAAYAGADFPFFKNVFSSYIMQWLTFTSGVTPNQHLFGDTDFWNTKFYERYTSNASFSDLAKIVGNTSTVFAKWLDHPLPDGYWDAMNPSPAQMAKINVPILTITGHYDGDQTGALTYYQEHMKYGSEEAKAKHYLIIGPWDHAGTRTPKKEVGGLVFGAASMLDLNQLHKQWYDWTMKNRPKPEFLKTRVAYYVMAADEWKHVDDLAAIAKRTRTLYLQSTGSAGDLFHSGSLIEKAISNGAAEDRYTYDPLDTLPGELELQPNPNYLTDGTGTLNLYGNGLVYHSEPFEKTTEITGTLKFSAWIAMDVPDTDLAVSVDEILPNGSSVHLTSDLMRARYRESLRKPKLVTSGEVNEYAFTTFQYFSRQIAKGSRLRLVLQCPNSIQLEKNYNTGGDVARETANGARIAHIRLVHDLAHPSHLELPVVE
jgi:putative CocE/NonD family hydrolase